RDGARLLLRVDRFAEGVPAVVEEGPVEQLELFAVSDNGGGAVEAPTLAPLAEVPAPPLHRVRRLSYSALSLFERCSYRYFAERVVGLRPLDATGSVPGQEGLAATEIGDAVHALLELVDLRRPAVPGDLAERVRARCPGAEEVEVVYQFLERPDDLVTVCYKVEETPALEAELSQAIAEIQAGEFRPTPSEFICADCPALNVVCAGPRLRR